MSTNVANTDAAFPDVDKERAAAEALGATFECCNCRTAKAVKASSLKKLHER